MSLLRRLRKVVARMNEIEVFSNSQFGAIRATEIDNEPWFCLADVCKPLGLEASKCKSRLKGDGLLTREGVDSMGRKNAMLWCNEGNLYRTIFQSKKPEAEAFTDWVTEEVLPSLRKTGTYSTARPSVSPSGLANLIRITRRVMLDMGNTPQEVGQMVGGMFEAWNVPLPVSFKERLQIPGQASIWEQGKLGMGAEV